MSTQEKEKTDAFLEDLINSPEKFTEFISMLSTELHKQRGQAFTMPRIEDAIRKVYRSYEVLPPELDLIQYEFEDLVTNNMVAVDNSSLSRRMKGLIAQHRMELYAR